MLLLYLTILFTCFLTVCSKQDQNATEKYSLGVELGQRTAARFAKQNDSQPVLVAKVLGSPAYRSYMADALASEGKRTPLHGKWFVKDNQGALIPAPPEAHDSEQARQVFVEELHNVQDAAWNALGKEAVVNALCIPNFFNDSSVRSVWDAVEEAGLRIHQPWQIIRWLNAARLAYSLNSCHAFGLDQKDCDIDEGPHQVVYVDYQPDTLELNVADVTEHGALPEYRARVLLVDDDERILSQIGNALTKLTQSSTFVRSQHRFGRFYFLRAIIVSGEVSQPSMEELHNVLVEAFPGQESKIRDSIDPLYIGAVGAAFKARYFTLHPEALRDYDYCQLGVELDEL